MTESLPKGYRIESTRFFGEALSHRNEKDELIEWFRLTNREFTAIDHYFGYLPSQLIEYLVKKRGKSLRIADIGGGRKSRCVAGIASKYGSALRVFNVDLVHNHTVPAEVLRVTGDVGSLPISGIDFALCYQLVPFLENNDGNYKKGTLAVKEIADVLRPGGIALIDETYFSSLPLLDPELDSLMLQTDSMFSTRRGNRSEPGEVIFGGPTHFLMVEKNPIDWNLATVRERLIGHI
ncbi:MAG: hypothetical protein Q8Q15_02965 [bacterium]|nr:hypothetical protein [bacterium]